MKKEVKVGEEGGKCKVEGSDLVNGFRVTKDQILVLTNIIRLSDVATPFLLGSTLGLLSLSLIHKHLLMTIPKLLKVILRAERPWHWVRGARLCLCEFKLSFTLVFLGTRYWYLPQLWGESEATQRLLRPVPARMVQVRPTSNVVHRGRVCVGS